MKYHKFTIIVSSACLIGGFIAGIFVGKERGIPFVRKSSNWSIGIYVGKELFNFVSPDNISNPVLTAKDVVDIPAAFVADPFMIKEGSKWYMFFEVMNGRTVQGDIGLAISNDGLNWSYKQIVLDEPFHLSYPYVFEWKEEYYMIPESYDANSVRLYKAVNFPTEWAFLGNLINGRYFDSSIFYFNKRWWLFSGSAESSILSLFYADDLMGPWVQHPKSPIIMADANIARPAGRVLIFNDQIFRFSQDDEPRYGNQVRVFEITELTTTSYKERMLDKNPILKASGIGWNRDGMHHIDLHQIKEDRWIACVDGFYDVAIWGFEY